MHALPAAVLPGMPGEQTCVAIPILHFKSFVAKRRFTSWKMTFKKPMLLCPRPDAFPAIFAYALPARMQYLERWSDATAGEGRTVQAMDETKTMTFDFIINVGQAMHAVESRVQEACALGFRLAWGDTQIQMCHSPRRLCLGR